MSSSEVCSQPGAPSHVEIRKLLSLCVRFYYALGNSRASSALARRAFRFPMPSSDALAVLVERNGPERTLVALTMLSTLLTKAREDAAAAAKAGGAGRDEQGLGVKDMSLALDVLPKLMNICSCGTSGWAVGLLLFQSGVWSVGNLSTLSAGRDHIQYEKPNAALKTRKKLTRNDRQCHNEFRKLLTTGEITGTRQPSLRDKNSPKTYRNVPQTFI